MNILHDFIVGGEIFAGAVAGLILLGLFVAGLRRLISGKSIADYPFTLTLEEKAQVRAAHKNRIARILVAFDIFCNVLFLNGQEDETISAHSWRAKLDGKAWGKCMSWWLDLFQTDHGARAMSGDLERAEERIAVEKKALGLN